MRNDIFLKEMGRRIREIRKPKKISLRQLSALIDIDRVTLMRIENGRNSSRILTLKSIADALDVDIKDFI